GSERRVLVAGATEGAGGAGRDRRSRAQRTKTNAKGAKFHGDLLESVGEPSGLLFGAAAVVLAAREAEAARHGGALARGQALLGVGGLGDAFDGDGDGGAVLRRAARAVVGHGGLEVPLIGGAGDLVAVVDRAEVAVAAGELLAARGVEVHLQLAAEGRLEAAVDVAEAA